MLVAVVSDTHRNSGSLKKVVNKVKNADILIHLGDNVDDVDELRLNFDNKIINVRGNCDFSVTAPVERIEEIGGKRIFITHGHRYGVKYNLMKLRYKAMEVEADVVLYGHTHISEINYEEGIWYINPGSAAVSRGKYNSIALIDINGDKIDPKVINI